jgi:hypothetical protein
MIYQLKNHGDNNERKYCEFISPDFPNYEILWSKYITPWSNRDLLPQFDLMWIQPRLNIPPVIEEFLMIHYSVFVDMIFVINQTNKGINEHRNSLRDIYSYFGHAIEMTNNLAIKILQMRIMVGLRKDDLFTEKNIEELISDFKKNFLANQQYNKKFRDYRTKQIPVIYTVQGTRLFLKEIVKDKRVREDFEKYFVLIQNYRNWLTHSPLPGCIEISTQKGKLRLVVKKEKIDKYFHWTDLSQIDNQNIFDFTEEQTLIKEEFETLKRKLNTLWGFFIISLKEIYDSPKMAEILKKTKINRPKKNK